MVHKYGRAWLVAAAGLIGVFAAPATALGADEPGVVRDAVVTVRSVDAADLVPVEGAVVRVTASGAVDETYAATTDASGTAVIEGVARQSSDGPAVVLGVSAARTHAFSDETTGCTFEASWHAERLGIEIPAGTNAVEIDFTAAEQSGTSTVQCPGPAPTGSVGGIVGRPQPTPPETDAGALVKPTPAAPAGPASILPALGLLLVAIGGAAMSLRRAALGRRVPLDRD